MTFDKDAMRARFWELTAQAEAIQANVAPLREAHDAFVNETAAKAREMHDAIKAAQEGLFDIENERAFLARGLGNVVGPRP